MGKSGIIAVLAAVAGLSACSTFNEADAEAPLSPPQLAEEPTCGAEAMTYLVGQPGQEIHEPSLPAPYRIISPGDAVTKDLRLNRLNIYLDENGVVSAVSCG